MYQDIFHKIVELSNLPDAREHSIDYLSEHLKQFLFPGERVLICFMTHEEGSLSWLMEQAALRCGFVPIVWGTDKRWMTLLRLAFSRRVTAIIGPPLVILGLSKLRKFKETPLSIRKVITAGYPCPQWMIEGIKQGLDCEAGGCFSLGEYGVVAGFACGQDWGIHLRDSEFGLEIVNDSGDPVEEGSMGEIVLYPLSHPHLRFPIGDEGRISKEQCPCGCKSPHIMDMQSGKSIPEDLQELGHTLQNWTSILDVRMERAECGLELEIIYFQGEKLPKLPTVAKLVMHPWTPETDAPFPQERPLIR